MVNLKNLKLVKQLKSLSPKLKWLMFSQRQDYKINSEYIDYITSDAEKEINSDEQRLETMVRETLIKEFSPDVQNMKSFDLLVDSVMHNLKNKQMQAAEDSETE